MTKNINKESSGYINIGLLHDKKSARNTFKLTEEAAQSLEWLKINHKLTVKEIFESISTVVSNESYDIKNIIDKIKKHQHSYCYGQRKTYVISIGTLKTLTNLSKEHDVSRDDLISVLIEQLKIDAKNNMEINKEKYNVAYEILSEFKTIVNDRCNRLEEVLRNDDLSDDIVGFLDAVVADGVIRYLEKIEELKKEK